MTVSFEPLLHAKTDLGLFLLLCRLMPTAYGECPLRTELESISLNDKAQLCLSIRQAFRYCTEQQTILRWESVHRFILDDSGQLTWERMGQPTLIGIEAIQTVFRQPGEPGEFFLVDNRSAS
jgi:hypothetical protein